MGSGVDDHMFPMQKTDATVGGFDLDCFWCHKTPRTPDQFGSAFLVKVEMHVHQASDHLALAFNHGRYVGFRVVSVDSEFLASPEIGNNLRAMNDVFARQAGDVRAGASHILSLNDSGLHPRFCQCPGEEFSC